MGHSTSTVLIITYYWPPGSGAGVQRWLKFSKYLPSYGWEPVILTVDPEFATYPATDNTLNKEIPANLKIIRTKARDWFRLYRRDKSKIPSSGFAAGSEKGLPAKIARFIRGNFFIPDPRRGWNRYAFKAASQLIESEKITHVITTSPPHSTQLIGLRLKKRYPDIRWIADLRDPWTDIYYYSSFYHTAPALMIDRYYEKKVLMNADRIITVGSSLAETFVSKLPAIRDRITIITNGYDSVDFEGPAPVRPEVFTISYTGTLSNLYPLSGFGRALSILAEEGIIIRMKFVGYISESQKAGLTAASGSTEIEFIPYLDHDKAIDMMRSSSALLLVIPDHYSNKSIITGKLFEYMATGNPILCLGPGDGDAAVILHNSGLGRCAGYDDPEEIAEIVKGFFNSSRDVYTEAPAQYSRKELTRNLVSLLENR